MTTLPKNGDVRVKARDDQAGSVCVIFNPSSTIFFETVCYIWENKGPKNARLSSTKRDRSKYVILRSADKDKLGVWYKEKINFNKDYKSFFEKWPPANAVIGVQIDSDSTSSSAEAFYRNFFLSTG